MKPREFAGAIRAAEEIYLWVEYSPDLFAPVAVSKTVAHEFVDFAKENDVEEINATFEDGVLDVGEPEDEDDEAPAETPAPGETDEPAP